ncbi:carbohydrate kinase family protein [uncultured Vagococcus sp.]|uniref:carbohydrate kinase family protein n=1 Tax=uncultured Vagococcus sp. TaxID=189676 RepID=UPI0028D50EF8|nr:carbohydrate kinase family protein [uncultured Vagococcus sp.]
MERKKQVVVVGDAVVDLVVHLPKVKGQQKILDPLPYITGGGTGANTAVALSRLGIPTSFIGSLGKDSYGEFVLNDLVREGVDISQVQVRSEAKTVGVFAFIDEDGERFLWGWPRENQAFKVLEYQAVSSEVLKNASWLHTTGMALCHPGSGRQAIRQLVKDASELKVPISFDLNLRLRDGVLPTEFKEVILEMIEQASYVFGSATDEWAYLGSGSWQETAISFATTERGIVARSSQGSTLFMGETVFHPSFKIPVKDTIGAGDASSAGLIAGLLWQRDRLDVLRMGNGVAAYKICQGGPRSLPTLPELKSFMASHRTRTKENVRDIT